MRVLIIALCILMIYLSPWPRADAPAFRVTPEPYATIAPATPGPSPTPPPAVSAYPYPAPMFARPTYRLYLPLGG